MAAWYLAHEDELLIDLDDYDRPTKSGESWGEVFFRRRLRSAIVSKKLKVKQVYLVRSSSNNHYHAIVRLEKPMPLIERLVWQMHLGSDLYRGRSDLMRAVRGIAAPSLIIQPTPIKGFYRKPDRICACKSKHRTEEQHAKGKRACPVWRELRGMSPWELFGEPTKCQEEPVKLPTGRVPLKLILACVTKYKRDKVQAQAHRSRRKN